MRSLCNKQVRTSSVRRSNILRLNPFCVTRRTFETLLLGLEKVHERECSCYTLIAVYDDVSGSMACSGFQSQVLNAEQMYARSCEPATYRASDAKFVVRRGPSTLGGLAAYEWNPDTQTKLRAPRPARPSQVSSQARPGQPARPSQPSS